MKFSLFALFAYVAFPAVVGLPSVDEQQVLGLRLGGMDVDDATTCELET
jgi:hypothetical protein